MRWPGARPPARRPLALAAGRRPLALAAGCRTRCAVLAVLAAPPCLCRRQAAVAAIFVSVVTGVWVSILPPRSGLRKHAARFKGSCNLE